MDVVSMPASRNVSPSPATKKQPVEDDESIKEEIEAEQQAN